MKVRSKIAGISIIVLMLIAVISLMIVYNNPKRKAVVFNENIIQIAKNNSEELSKKEDKDLTRFSSKTLMVKSERELPEVSAKNIEKINDIYILQFETEEDTEKAYESLQGKGISYIDIDAKVDASDTETVTEEQIQEFMQEMHNSEEAVNELCDDSSIKKYIDSSKTDKEILVALIDSGIDKKLEVFQNRIVDIQKNYSSTGAKNDIADDFGHGTEIANVIATGTGSNVKLMPIKVLNDSGTASILNTYMGIEEAINQGADLINISLNVISSKESKLLSEAIQDAHKAGIPVVVSAGKRSMNIKYVSPSNVEEAIVVSATDILGKFASQYSNYGNGIDYASLGTATTKTKDGEVVIKTGTSYAAANVSAIIANILTFEDDYEKVLNKYAIDNGTKGYDKYYGNGYIGLKEIIKDESEPESKEWSILDVEDWHELSKEELIYIINTTATDPLAIWLHNLTSEEMKYILSLDTRLNEEQHSTVSDANTREVLKEYDEKYYQTLLNAYSPILENIKASNYWANTAYYRSVTGKFYVNVDGTSVTVTTTLKIGSVNSLVASSDTTITCSVASNTKGVSISDYGLEQGVDFSKTNVPEPHNKRNILYGTLKFYGKKGHFASYSTSGRCNNHNNPCRMDFKKYNETTLQGVEIGWNNSNNSDTSGVLKTIKDADNSLYTVNFQINLHNTGQHTYVQSATSNNQSATSETSKYLTNYNATFKISFTKPYTYTYKPNFYNRIYNEVGVTRYCSSVSDKYQTKMPGVEIPPLTRSAFSAPYLKLKFDANGGSCSESERNVYAKMMGWYWINPSNNKGVYQLFNDSTGACGYNFSRDANTTFYAQWQDQKVGTLPTPTRTGYTFDGWYTAATGGTRILDSTVLTSTDTTAYAHWSPIQYTIKFDLNKGTGSTTPYLQGNSSPADKTMTYDVVDFIYPPTREGYTFAGWTITGMDSTTHYWGTSSSSLSSSTATSSSSNKNYYFKNLRSTSGTVTFKAIWTANKYTLTINPNGGWIYGEGDGGTGWYSSSQTRKFTFDESYQFANTRFSYNGDYNEAFTLDRTLTNGVYLPYRQGYDFTNWGITSGGGSVSTASTKDGNNVPCYNYIYDSKYDGNTTVTAQWTPQVLTIKLDDQKPSYDKGWKDVSPNVIYEKYGVGYYTDSGCSPDKKFTAIDQDYLPQRTGYIFQGYYTAVTDGNPIIDKNGNLVGSNKQFYKAKDNDNKDFVIYAHWEPISYIVKYTNTSGTGAKDRQDNPVSEYTQTDFKFDTAKSLTANKFRRVYNITYKENGGQPITTTTANKTATYTFKGWDDKNTFRFHDVDYTSDQFIAPYYANTYSEAYNTYGYDKCGLLRDYIGSRKLAVGKHNGYPNQASVKNLTSTQNGTTTKNGTVVLDALWNDGKVILPDAPERPADADGTEYEFIGWFNKKYADTDNSYGYEYLIGAAGKEITPTEDMELYARWHIIKPNHPVGYQAEPTTKINVTADWIDKSTDNANSDYDIYKGNNIPDADKVNTNGIAKVTMTLTIADEKHSGLTWEGKSTSFTATAVSNVIKETIDTEKWTYVTSTPVSVSNGNASYSNGVITWTPENNVTGTITMTYHVKLKEDYWDVATKTNYNIESKNTEWSYRIGGYSNNLLYDQPRTNIYDIEKEPVTVQMRPVDWNPNNSNGGYVSKISISSDNSNTKGSAWNFYQKKNETNTYYVKYNTKSSEAKSQFKLAFYGVLKRAREGYQINNMYFDSHYSKDSKTQTYDYFTDNLEKIGQKYTWSSTTLTNTDWYYAKDITPHTGNKATLLNLVKTENTRSKDTSGIAANSNDPRTKLTSTQTNTVTNGDNGARISVYPQVRINGDNTYYNANQYVMSDTDVDSKKISLVVDAKDPTLTYKSGSETNFYDKDTNEGTNIDEGNYIDINLTDSYRTEADKTLTFTFGDDVSGISDPDRYNDDWITNSNQNVQIRLERLGYKEDGTIVTNAEYDKMSTSEKAKVSNDPKVIYDNKNGKTNDVVNINYNDDGLGGNFKVNLKKNNEETLGHLRMTVRIIDNVGNYYDKVYDFYVLKVTGKVELSKYLPRYEKAVIDRKVNIFKKGEAGTASISAKGYVDRITAYFGDDMTKWTEDEAKLHNVFASDNYHINGDYPRDYDKSKVVLLAKYQKLAWGYENDELGGLPVKLSSQYTKTITVTKDVVNNNLATLKNGNVVIVPATYENGALVQDSYTLQFSTEVNSDDLPKYIIVNGKDKAKLTWKDGKVSFDKITTTSTDWVTVNGEKLRPMIHAFYVPFGASEGNYTVIVTAYKDGHKVKIGLPYTVDGNILSDIRTRIRDN